MTDTLHDLFAVPRDVRWQTQASCAEAEPELFTSESGRDVAVLIGRRCPVCPICLEHAPENDERFGVVSPARARQIEPLALPWCLLTCRKSNLAPANRGQTMGRATGLEPAKT